MTFALDLATFPSSSSFSAPFLLECFFSMNHASAISSPILNFSLIALSFDDDFDNELDFPDLLECFDDLQLLNFDTEFDFLSSSFSLIQLYF